MHEGLETPFVLIARGLTAGGRVLLRGGTRTSDMVLTITLRVAAT